MSTRFSTKDLSSPDDDAHDVDAIISQQPDAPIIVGSIGVEAQIAAADWMTSRVPRRIERRRSNLFYDCT